MGIFGALTTAVTGLKAQSFALENISGNIANSQTTAFKRIDTSFLDLIPQTALQGVGDNASVFLIKEDSTIEVRAVSPGAKNGSNITIRGGLQAGDRVAIDNFEKLSEGTKVAVEK